jgi:hypothetical protein
MISVCAPLSHTIPSLPFLLPRFALNFLLDPTAGTSCRPCTTCLSETYARSDAQCGGHTNGPGDSADRVCLACPTMSRTAENNSVAIDSCICESGYANIPSGPGAFTCVECDTADCDQCGPQDTCTKCKAGLTLKDNTCSVITSCGAGYFMFNSSCVECTVCSDLSPLMVTKTGCTESEDTQCGYNTAAAQMLMSPEMEEVRVEHTLSARQRLAISGVDHSHSHSTFCFSLSLSRRSARGSWPDSSLR